jgi:deazaflavin-dependent oxidoreductase (nitroreductase family)
MSETFLYLTTVGRTTGLPRQIEIWFVEHESRYYLCAELREGAGWVKNLTRQPRVRFAVGERGAALEEREATARIVDEEDLTRAVKSRFEEKYGWSDGLLVEISP